MIRLAPRVAAGLSAMLSIVATQAWTQDTAAARLAAADAAAGLTRFKCQAAPDVTARFIARNATLIAIVDAGQGPHELTLSPWSGGQARMTWSDGRRTLTWSPGVQIMWLDGPAHRMSGRGGHRH